MLTDASSFSQIRDPSHDFRLETPRQYSPVELEFMKMGTPSSKKKKKTVSKLGIKLGPSVDHSLPVSNSPLNFYVDKNFGVVIFEVSGASALWLLCY